MSSFNVTEKFIAIVTFPIVIGALLFSLVLSGVEILNTREQEVAQSQALTERYTHLFTGPLWNLDNNITANLAENVSLDPQIECIILVEQNLRTNSRTIGTCSPNNDGNIISVTKEINYQHGEQTIYLGELTLRWYKADIRELIWKQLLSNTFLAFLLLVIFGLTTYVVIRKIILKPLRKIEKSVSTTDVHNERPIVDYKSGDEIGRFCDVYNASIHLQNEAIKEIEDSRALALKAENAQSVFLANMSHEIRTPLNTIIGASYMLQQKSPAGDQGKYLRSIDVAGKYLLGLVNDVIDITRVKSGQIEFSEIDFTITQIADDISVQSRGLLAGRDDLDILVNRKFSREKKLLGDPVRVTQVLANFIHNAVKFTKSGNILVDIEEKAKDCDYVVYRFSVTDSGKGIDTNMQASIFEMFTQDKNDFPISQNYMGSGLGLHLCKSIVEELGSRIELTSKPGEGSCFSFDCRFARRNGNGLGQAPFERQVYLVTENEALQKSVILLCGTLGVDIHPITCSELTRGDGEKRLFLFDDPCYQENAGQLDALVTEKDRVAVISRHDMSRYDQQMEVIPKPITARRLKHVLSDAQPVEQSTQASTMQDDAGLGDKTFLVVDDNSINLSILKDILVHEGAGKVVTADSGLEALDKVFSGQMDIILLDDKMPGMNGVEVALQIRERFTKDQLPIIGLSASAFRKDEKKCLDAGMNHFLPKPVDPVQLMDLIGATLTQTVSATPEQTGPQLQTQDRGDLLNWRDSTLFKYGKGSIYMNTLGKFEDRYKEFPYQVAAGIEAGDREEFSRMMHTVAGLAETIGAQGFARICRRWEEMVETGMSMEGFAEELSQQEPIFRQTIEEIRSFMRNAESEQSPPILAEVPEEN